MSKIIEALRSAVKHRKRISLDDIDCINLLEQIAKLEEGLHAAYLVGYHTGHEKDTHLLRQALAALDQAGFNDSYRNYDMESAAKKAIRERLA